MSDPGLSCEILHQIDNALHRIERRLLFRLHVNEKRAEA
jgi:hypothetical protein